MILTSNTPIEGLWALVCSIQLISYFTMMNFELPPNLKSFMEYMEKVHSFGAVVPNVLTKMRGIPILKIKSIKFYERGFTTPYSLYLCGSDIEMIIIQVLVAVMFSKIATK